MLELNRSRATHKREGTDLQPLRPVQEGTPPPVGSAWDVATDPEGLRPHHLADWVEGSAVAPELAAANLLSISGPAVLEALAGERLDQLGGHAAQYVTATAARILRPLEPLAAAGGWWCSGLDPLADWAQMAWGIFKPDQPRTSGPVGFGEPEKPRKYENPIGTRTRSIWLRVPAAIAPRAADRFGLALPPEVAADADGSAGAFWRWLAGTPALPLVVTEGAKKAAALLSIGVPAVALPGIWNGAPKNPATGRPALLPELAAVPLTDRPVWVLFDASDKADPAEPLAADRLGRLLAAAGADVRVGIVPGAHGKGADDHLRSGGGWEALAAALLPLGLRPVLPRLRAADRIAPAGVYLGDAYAIPSPENARLVALAAPMGSGKTEAIAAAVETFLQEGRRVLLVTYRRSLGAALAERLGLPWAEDVAPGSDLRQQGLALCVDSFCPTSGQQITPDDWRDCVVVIDEACAVLAHALKGTGTAIARRRPPVLETLAAVLRNASQVIVADAQLSDPVLEAIETITGQRAELVASKHRPAAGRRLIVHPTRESWRSELVDQLKARRRLWIATTAAKEGVNAAKHLAEEVHQHWPEGRVLVVDSDTVADDSHDASRLAEAPDAIAGRYDVVVASPAVAAGLSVTLRGHFDAVMVAAGGITEPDAIAQAAARVRDDCPRHLFAPEQSPGNHLRTGSGDGDPDAVLRHLGQHEALTVAQLVAAGADLERGTVGPWLRLWARIVALLNRQRLAYRATVRGLLEREGYESTEAAELSAAGKAQAMAMAESLQDIADKAQADADAATIAAEPISATEAATLERKRKRSPAERAKLARFRVAQTWGLGSAEPSPALLEADREQLSQRRRFAWLLQDHRGRQLAAQHDLALGAETTYRGRTWAPDLCRDAIGPKLTAADAVGLAGWLARADSGEWFTATDSQLLALQSTALAHAASLRQVLGVSPGKRAITTLRALLSLAGYRVESHRCRSDGERAWRYRVTPEPLPEGADPERLQAAWVEQLQERERLA